MKLYNNASYTLLVRRIIVHTSSVYEYRIVGDGLVQPPQEHSGNVLLPSIMRESLDLN